MSHPPRVVKMDSTILPSISLRLWSACPCFTRQVYVKRGNLLYLTPRPEAEARLEGKEKDVGEKLAKMQAVAGGSQSPAR